MNNEMVVAARMAFDAERWDDAVSAAEAALDDQAEDLELLWILGRAHLKQERFAQAVPFLLRAAQQGSVDPVRYWALGLAFSEIGEFGRAELWLLRSLALRDTYDTRIALALVYMRTQEPAAAEGVHTEGLRLRPDDAERVEAYADFLSDSGRDDEAKSMYERATTLKTGSTS